MTKASDKPCRGTAIVKGKRLHCTRSAGHAGSLCEQFEGTLDGKGTRSNEFFTATEGR